MMPIAIQKLGEYLHHLPTCYTMQNWDEALQALADTPKEFQDEDWYLAHQEIEHKRNTCNCGKEVLKGIIEDKFNDGN